MIFKNNIILLTVLSPCATVLSNRVVSAERVNTFKRRLDQFWSEQDVMYNYKTDLHGVGKHSIIV